MAALAFQLTSPAFVDGGIIPTRYTCRGENNSPPLQITGTPSSAASLLLVVHDPDAPSGDFVHWMVWNLNPSVKVILENELPDDALQGTNSSNRLGYMGPCPPSDVHRYIFNLYALDTVPDLHEGAPEEDVLQVIADHALAKTTLLGRFGTPAMTT